MTGVTGLTEVADDVWETERNSLVVIHCNNTKKKKLMKMKQARAKQTEQKLNPTPSLPSGGLVEVVFLEVLSEVGVSVVPE